MLGVNDGCICNRAGHLLSSSLSEPILDITHSGADGYLDQTKTIAKMGKMAEHQRKLLEVSLASFGFPCEMDIPTNHCSVLSSSK